MIALLTLLAAASAEEPLGAPDSDRLPPEPPASIPDLPSAEPPPAIFLYTVDSQCRIDDTRKLQGPESISWRDVQRVERLFQQDTTWRFVDGERRQLYERRVKLQGEMVLAGELVCYVLPSGQVVEAWIERRGATGRRRAPTRESIDAGDGAVEQLGTFSVELTIRPAP